MFKKSNLILKKGYLCLLPFVLFTACKKGEVTTPVTPQKKWIVSTVAGSSQAGYKDGDSTQVQFNNAQSIFADNNGSLFVGDIANASIRQVTYAGHVTTYAGRNIGTPDLLFGNISSVIKDTKGNIFTIEYSLIRKITSPVNSSMFAGDLWINYLDGTGTKAAFNVINSMAIDKQDNIFLPDFDMSGNLHLRKVTPDGVVSTLALQDNTGYPSNGGPDHYWLSAIAVDATGNIYFTGNGNSLIKKVDPAGNVTLFAGGADYGFKSGKGAAASFNLISSLACDAAGNVWVSDNGNHAIRKVTPDGTVTTVAGTGSMGYKDGEGLTAIFKFPSGITVDNNGVVFIMDRGNNRVRRLEYK